MGRTPRQSGQPSPQPIVITTSAACTTSSAHGLGNSFEMSIARGLKDWVADRTHDPTARQAAYPPGPTLFVPPGTRPLVEIPICRQFELIVWATGLGHEESGAV